MKKKNLGDQLAEARRAAGMSQEELGEAVGASGRTVSTWETNVHLPTKRVQSTIEALYGWPAGSIAYTIRTGSALPAVTKTFEPGRSIAGDGASDRARVAQNVAEALELLSERMSELEDRMSRFESRRPAKASPARRAR